MPLHFCFEMTLWFNIIKWATFLSDPGSETLLVGEDTDSKVWVKTLCWMESTQQSLRIRCSKMPLLFNEPCFNVFAFLMPYLKRPLFWDNWCIEGLQYWYWNEAHGLKVTTSPSSTNYQLWTQYLSVSHWCLKPQKWVNLKNQEKPRSRDLQELLAWRRWRRSQRPRYKFRLVGVNGPI